MTTLRALGPFWFLALLAVYALIGVWACFGDQRHPDRHPFHQEAP